VSFPMLGEQKIASKLSSNEVNVADQLVDHSGLCILQELKLCMDLCKKMRRDAALHG